MPDSQQLLAEYVENGSETAFNQLVANYINLVHSAAVRLVNGDTHLAEDITQTVFADFARKARSLSREVMIGGWLHRHTCFVAANVIRGERRRQARERQAVEMSFQKDYSAQNLALVAPVLDEAIDQLGKEDRTAILLRFFEQKDFPTLGEHIGSSEEAARKRVNRALEKLHTILKRRGVTLSVTALGSILTAHSISAAPIGMAANIAVGALAATGTSATTTFTLFQIMSMTKVKVAIISAVVVIGATVPLVMQYQSRNEKLRAENEALRQAAERSNSLAAENERLAKLAARPTLAQASTNEQFREVQKLRGEVGRLREQNASQAAARTNGPSALSGVTSDPAMYKAIRDQQKTAMKMVYQDFAKRIKLTPEQSDKLSDLLADDIMENVDQITKVLREGKTPEEMNQVFTAQEAALQEKVRGLLGDDGLAQYQTYTRDLVNYLTTEQFKPMMSGNKAAKEQKGKQFYQLMQEETQQAIANAGLGADYQVIPMLNFRNIASEEEGEKSLKFLDGIYERVAARAGTFLDAKEIAKLQEFRKNALSGNRMALVMNRKMMAPAAK